MNRKDNFDYFYGLVLLLSLVLIVFNSKSVVSFMEGIIRCI